MIQNQKVGESKYIFINFFDATCLQFLPYFFNMRESEKSAKFMQSKEGKEVYQVNYDFPGGK